MTQIVIDPQASGWRDDGSESGLSRVELVRGRLVAVPFRRNTFATSTTGGASGGTMRSLYPENDDGTQSGIVFTVPPSASLLNCGTLSFWVQGNVFGLRLDKAGAYAPDYPVGCTIDGVAYAVTTAPIVPPDTQVTNGFVPGLYSQILATDLGDGPHYVELSFPGAVSGATRTWGVMGFLADSRAGYAPMPRGVGPSFTPIALTTSFQNLLSTTSIVYGIRKVFFNNTTAGAVTVNVRHTSVTGVFWSRSVPANDTLEFDPGAPIYDTLEVSASTTGVNATVMGLI